MTLGSHQTPIGASQVWLTPKWIIDALGPFDLDPCAADPRPWDCAEQNLTVADDGLSPQWRGRVWLNPPFDRREVGLWVEKLSRHGEGTALLHARTEAVWFRFCWTSAKAMLFLASRIKFCRPDGIEADANSGAPPVLVAFGEHDANQLKFSGIPGFFVYGWRPQGL